MLLHFRWVFNPINSGRAAAPPDDSGGIWGYEDKLSVLADEDHPEHEEISEWMGKDIDPEFFDIAEINSRFTS